jgi:glycine dehydrogenase
MEKPDTLINPDLYPREFNPYYISASKQDIQDMLESLGLNQIEDLFSHLPESMRMTGSPGMPERLSYEGIMEHIHEISQKNKISTSFLGDGLPQFLPHPIVDHVSSIRGLTTAYTPYQPERSQGTLESLWLYQSCLSMLTGFEAINASMYERSTCLMEAILCASRLKKSSATVLVLESIYPGDLEVLKTLSRDTQIKIHTVPVDPSSGITEIEAVQEAVNEIGELCALVFPQVNHFGNLENIHGLTDLTHALQAQAVAIVDPMLLAPSGLIPPSDFGAKGSDLLVGEGQSLAIGPNFGGPGLGVFGIRCNAKQKNAIRSTAGRYVGAAIDQSGNPCKALVLSTREQHIRKEKATSNICSNQSFVATLAGAALLAHGDIGLKEKCSLARKNALRACQIFTQTPGCQLAFPSTPFFNEFTLRINTHLPSLVKKAADFRIELGVDVSSRLPSATSQSGGLLLVSCSDIQGTKDFELLEKFLSEALGKPCSGAEKSVEIPMRYLRDDAPGIPRLPVSQLESFYTELGEQNISPDHGPYPLGSCTMKYNPYINDVCAGFSGFTDSHPQALEENSQGSLEILFQIQESFKKMLGLSAVTTQPVAGAQGELVGLKMFQAYHKDHSSQVRDIILIPRSAHGTNYASVTMAGFPSRRPDGKPCGLVLVEADPSGRINRDQFQELLDNYGSRIAGIMITNPNTSGILESHFQEIAEQVHAVGGLVYMDGANLNAIAGWADLGKMGVDAVHSNLHKTFSIPHGGGGPGDAIVAVSQRLEDYLPGHQIIKTSGTFSIRKAPHSIGSVHRHFGNFAHKVRCYAYLLALGDKGLKQMSALAVLSARYMAKRLSKSFPLLPSHDSQPRMHEFILTLSPEDFEKIEATGIKHALVIMRVGKLFLDYGLHAPTVAWPETYGLMVEPTESYAKAELDRFCEVVEEIHHLIREYPEVLHTVPHFTPVERIDEVGANRELKLSEKIRDLPEIPKNRFSPQDLAKWPVRDITQKILQVHREHLS